MSDEPRAQSTPADEKECSEPELEGIQGGTVVDEPDPFGRTAAPRPIIEGPDPV